MAQRESGVVAGSGTAEPRTVLRRAGDRAVYLALRAAWILLGALSLKAARAWLESIGGVFARLDRHHRRIIESNLEIAFPSMDHVVREQVVVASFRNWGRIAAEVAHGDAIVEQARHDPEWTALAAAVREGLSGGRGLLLLTAHLGNFELLARIVGASVVPIAVFHRPLGVAEADAFLLRDRRRCRVTSLGRGAAVRDAMRTLAAGGCVALPLDQNQREGRGIFVDVLGHPACTSTVLARLSLASGAPVLPVFAVWNGDRTLPVIGELRAPPPVAPPPAERGPVIRSLTEAYSREVDRVVRRFPHQWNWAHRRWKTRPPGDG